MTHTTMKKTMLLALAMALTPVFAQDAPPQPPARPDGPPGPPQERGDRMNRAPRISPEVMGMLILGRDLLMKTYDTDKDGRLSPTEMDAIKDAMEAKKADFIKRYDTDGDGKISPKEFEALKEAWTKDNPMLEKHLNEIISGLLPRPERRRPQGERPEPGERKKEDRPDASRQEERPAPRPAGDRDRPPRPGHGPLGMLGVRGPQDPSLLATVCLIIEQYDKDKDGILSAEEYEAFTGDAKTAMKKRHEDMEKRRQEFLKKYDKDGDGKLSPDERQAMREEWRKQRTQQ